LSVVGIRHVEIEAGLEEVSKQHYLSVGIAQTGTNIFTMFAGHDDYHVVSVEVVARRVSP
jgi:hypothetical protein